MLRQFANVQRDVFICHAREDKDAVARPLGEALTRLGLTVWLDEDELQIGDSLLRKIDEGLARSTFGAVILSPSFFVTSWARRELDGLATREVADGTVVILPIWHHVDAPMVRHFSPPLADKVAASTELGIEEIAKRIARRVRSARIHADSAPPANLVTRWSAQEADAPVVPSPVNLAPAQTGEIPVDGPPRAEAPNWSWQVPGAWVALVVGDGVRLLQAAGHRLVGVDAHGTRRLSKAVPVPVGQLIAAASGTALVGMGDGQLLQATVDHEGDVVVRPNTGEPPEVGVTLLGALVQRNVVRVIASSANRTMTFQLGANGRPFQIREVAASASRSATLLQQGIVRVGVEGDLTVIGDVLAPIRDLPASGWTSFDHAGSAASSVFAGVRSDTAGDWLDILQLTDVGPRQAVVELGGGADRVQVSRSPGRAPSAVFIQQGGTVVGWPLGALLR